MKTARILGFILLLYRLQSCSHTDHPAKNIPSAPHPAPVAFIVVDGMGNIRTPKNQLPITVAQKANYTAIARAFTPNQRKNPLYRFNTIPPRDIYVSPAYTRQSLKGTYCIYKKKFWYWQDADGLFYLDETYHQ
jgi:hypothetical protein